MTHTAWSRNEMAQLIAADIPEGSVVNIGIGMPELVANYLDKDKDILLQSENGILGMGPMATDEEVDGDLVNAGKKPVTLLPGGCFFDHTTSFSMMRGGHLDFAILGGFQVSETGDLANWSTGQPDAIPAVGGAMDLAVGAKQVFVMMEMLTKQGKSKLVRHCTYPLTGLACVKRVYTDLAVFDVTPNGFAVRVMAPGMTLGRLQELGEVVFDGG
ncbi:3-oxoacid CoA-transferase subunit B [Bradyrhizobium sp. GCM10027634]|uniref:3-oxoacid CoA-transferase subunit B n=1 Tax=unclassified Bradyrhizobium TaxID=2631580 RepID=UPI00263B0555|nr:3-oxoacid CoA-transferase subunit B [Bradyrhizobium sp. WYCCWR 12677]MDN5005481.1 3-oxoacid CoA-transferase subunit B [Bradyrhizobium sp. WYCCWR 12677]